MSLKRYITPSGDLEDDGEEMVADDDLLDVADRTNRWLAAADDLTQKAALRDQAQRTLDKKAPFTRINPVSALQGTLGGQQQVVSGTKMQVAMWGAAADAETLPVSVVFAPVQQITPQVDTGAGIGYSSYRPYGIIKFGTRGFLVEAEVDIERGVQFVVPASFVSLEVAMEPTVNGHANGTMKLAGMLSFYPVNHTPDITRTVYVDGVAGGAFEDVLVPAFARKVWAWRQSNANDLTLKFNSVNGTTLYQYTIAGGSSLLDPIPLSGDVAVIEVSASGGVGKDLSFVRLIFGLAF